jgi:thioredoxin-like negative regulator of GroEL
MRDPHKRRRPRRFENAARGHSNNVPERTPEPASSSHLRRDLPTLVFVSGRRSGASRRMESLVAWVKVTQKSRLRVVDLDADRAPELVRRLEVREVPSLLVLERGQVVDRLEGRATGRQIEELIRPHIAA